MSSRPPPSSAFTSLQVLVKFKPQRSAQALEEVRAKAQAHISRPLLALLPGAPFESSEEISPLSHLFWADAQGPDAAALIEELSALPGVEYAEVAPQRKLCAPSS